MTSIATPICMGCRHLVAGTLTCAAFPAGIPDAILQSERDHRRRYRGDGGLTFDPVDQAATRRAARRFAPLEPADG